MSLAALFLVTLAAPQDPPIAVTSLEEGWRFAKDPEGRGAERGYAEPAFDDAAWSPIRVDRPWEAQGFADYDGFAWYRLRFRIGAKPEGAALLELGTIDDVDEVFLNGTRVGGLGAFPPNPRTAWTERRAYPIPLERLREGENVLAVRVYDEVGDGGLRGGRHRLSLGPGAPWLVAARTRKPQGFAAANFGFAMELGADGEFPARLWHNPTIPGAWLEEEAVGSLSFREGEIEVGAAESLAAPPARHWPFARARYRHPKIPGISIELEAFCPVARVGRPYWGAMPVGFATVRVRNDGDRPREVDLRWRFALEGAARHVVAEQVGNVVLSGFDGERLSLRSDGRAAAMSGDAVKLWSCRVSVDPGRYSDVHLCFARSPRESTGSPDGAAWPDSSELARESLRRVLDARRATEAIDQWLPQTGDAELDEALRWYCSGAVQLTKVFTDGTAAVMGYAEMTQRDGFWGSFLHNVLFPDLERKMVEEVFAAQSGDGKVPTAILPTIDRGDDLDTNAYALLRAFRYARWNADPKFLSSLAANLKGAAVWLQSRDRDGDGLPEAGSYWCDWKDVRGLADRKHSPHATFLYLAALGELLGAMRDARGNDQAFAELEERWLRGRARADARVEDGGLWTGRFYAERWKDGRAAPQVNEDQIVGILFGVVPAERAGLVFGALAPSRRPWGVRESFPYRPAGFGYRPGDYANGAVWPWLNYADAWARLRAGRAAEGLALLRDVARRDVLLGSGLPHECLDGETGEAMRNAPQAWNASFFGAVFHGLLGVERGAGGALRIAPTVAAGRGWRVRAPVPEGEVEAADGVGAAPPVVRWSLTAPLEVEVAIPGFRPWKERLAAGQGSKALER